jgi:putative tricarboxylic transport membrane protein
VDVLTIGIPELATLANILAIVLGCIIGLWAGALPGLSGVSATAIILPLTFGMPPLTALLLLTSIHTSSEYGGAISAILMNVPGDASAAAAAFDGYPMARQGRAGIALGVSSLSSLTGAFCGSLVVAMASAPALRLVVAFGPPEYVALAILGLTVVSVVSSGSALKGLLMSLLGICVSFIGIDPVIGVERYTFGSIYLQGGIGFIPIVTGLFAVSELIFMILRGGTVAETGALTGSLWDGMLIALGKPLTLAKSFITGTLLGLLPGIGATATNFLAYSIVQKTSRDPESFGRGNPEGVMAPEVANNACIHAGMIPALTMGVPGGASSAILIVALTIQGLRPGPALFSSNPVLINGLYAGLFASALCSFALMTVFIRIFARVTVVPLALLAPVLLVLSIVASYASQNSITDLFAAVVFGLLGYLLRLGRFPLVNLMMGFILGKLLETSFAQSLMMSGGSYGVFFQRPITLVLLSIPALLLAGSALRSLRRA